MSRHEMPLDGYTHQPNEDCPCEPEPINTGKRWITQHHPMDGGALEDLADSLSE